MKQWKKGIFGILVAAVLAAPSVGVVLGIFTSSLSSFVGLFALMVLMVVLSNLVYSTTGDILEAFELYLPEIPLPGWPRFWELFGFCLPRKTRDKVYEPCHVELLEDYQLARKYRTKWARRWLTVCFTFRTTVLIADCWRVLLKDGAVKILLGFIPWPLR